MTKKQRTVFYKFDSVTIWIDGQQIPDCYVEIDFTRKPKICACGIDRRDCSYHREDR